MMIEQTIAIGLDRVHFPVTALGPGRRVGIWTRSMDVVFGPEGDIWLAGIPRPGDLESLSEHLATAGLSAKTSAGRLRGRS